LLLLVRGSAGNSAFRGVQLQSVAGHGAGETRASAFTGELEGHLVTLHAASQLTGATAAGVAAGQRRSLLLDIERDLAHFAFAAAAGELPLAREHRRGLRQHSWRGNRIPAPRPALQRRSCADADDWPQEMRVQRAAGNAWENSYRDLVCRQERPPVGGRMRRYAREGQIPRGVIPGGGEGTGRITARQERYQHVKDAQYRRRRCCVTDDLDALHSPPS